MTVTGRDNNRGGFRPGSGRKPIEPSQRELKRLLREVKKKAAERGATWQSIFAELLFDSIASPKDRIAAFKVFMEYVLVRKSEQNVNVTKTEGPTIYLPEMKPDPAKIIAIDGKRATG